ncbi:MAG TPA: hypothetical protein VFV33_22700, partial [Gemmatimonadaceae bacterium]|nr:hypothetical protein [Gemmatimonadaceae bacterium]
ITLSTGTTGSFEVVLGVSDAAVEVEQRFQLTVTEPALPTTVQVEAVSATPSGVRVRFDRALGVTRLDASALELSNAQGQPQSGTLVLDADQAGLTFVRTGAALEAGSYTLRLKSGAHRIANLDGNGDGSAGDDYQGPVSIGASTALGRVSVADLLLAPGQSATLPIQLIATGKVTAVRFSLIYDAALLTLESATLAAGLPAGTLLSANLTVPGYARLVVSAPKGLAAGTLNLIELKAKVPATAGLGSVRVLDVAEVVLNGNQAGADDDGVHWAGEAPVREPMAPLAVMEITAPAQGEAAPEPSLLSKLLTRLKDALAGTAALSPAAVAPETMVVPKLAAPTATPEAVRTLSAAPIAIDLKTVALGPSASTAAVPASAPSGTDWKAGFVVAPALNPNTTLKVTLK